MKGFDLYRVTLGYLGVIFALCAVVVFDPLSSGRSGGGVAGADRADGALADGGAVPLPQPVDDPAEVVARLVAEKYFAEFGEDIGQGDASGRADLELNPQEALVAAGSDVAYTVGPGESLGSLALRFYGDSALAPLIYEANRGLMASPDRLRVGQVVIIPGRS